ncbi:MAG: L-dopachrome tautomerase-related protein [Phycisphaerales bacterium]
MRYRVPAAVLFTPILLIAVLLGTGCATTGPMTDAGVDGGRAADAGPDFDASRLESLAQSVGFQWTGVAASADGRIFVSHPRWDGPYKGAVFEIVDGRARRYPDGQWNRWPPAPTETQNERDQDPAYRFVCVQSVHIDAKHRMWVLDPASPGFGGVVPGAAKLVEIDLETDRVVRVIRFDESIAPEASYLNDVRLDVERNVAFITDSGLGAIIVVDLETNRSRRVLASHRSTKAEADAVPVIGGREWRFGQTPAGEVPQIHSDGIAYNPADDHVYYQALTARTLYRIPASVLADFEQPEWAIRLAIEDLGPSVLTDGMDADADGNVYFTALERDAIVYRTPAGEYRTLVTSENLSWPDSLAITPEGVVFTTARIHETKGFSFDGLMPSEPYGLWRAPLPGE